MEIRTEYVGEEGEKWEDFNSNVERESAHWYGAHNI
jgi:hypothetical protein